MNDAEFIQALGDNRIIAVLRGHSAANALRAAEAAMVGGIKIIEVSLTTPGGFRVISDLRHRYGDRVLIGAGSVMAYDHVDRAVKSGAHFISMPHTSSPLVEVCRRHRIPAIVGALTPTEVAIAWSMGMPLVAVYPAGALGGPEYFAGLVSRMADVRLAASGGVGAENISDYFAAGAFTVAIGSRLFTSGDLKNENYAAIAERARGLLRLAGVA